VQVSLAQLQKYPIWQVPLASLQGEDKDFVQVPLAQITWYHHISLLSKVKDKTEGHYTSWQLRKRAGAGT
jgi:hypothetical protein